MLFPKGKQSPHTRGFEQRDDRAGRRGERKPGCVGTSAPRPRPSQTLGELLFSSEMKKLKLRAVDNLPNVTNASVRLQTQTCLT